MSSFLCLYSFENYEMQTDELTATLDWWVSQAGQRESSYEGTEETGVEGGREGGHRVCTYKYSSENIANSLATLRKGC